MGEKEGTIKKEGRSETRAAATNGHASMPARSKLHPIYAALSDHATQRLLNTVTHRRSLPLDRGGRLRRHVIAHAVDALDLVDNPVGDLRKQAVRHVIPVRSHEVRGGHRPEHAHVLVGAVVAHDADRLHGGQEHSEGLADLVVVAAAHQLLQVDRVRRPERIRMLRRDLADDSDAEARTREGVSHDGLLGEPQLPAQSTHLILEKQPKGLDEFHLHPRGQAADVVVGLDDGGRSPV
mmetsp:Transcript_155872/g.498185  ORF Transcript_155872/g.498185 Transcript_155872/m.498185 type:complete len:237 (-) Transcript_155872:803-1513(-)